MIKKLIFMIMASIVITLNSSPALACSDHALLENKYIVQSMYAYLSSLKRRPLVESDLNHYFTENVKMIINGSLSSKGINEFYNHFKMMLKKSRHYQFVFTKNGMIAEGNKVAIKYQLIIYSHSQKKTMHVIAFFIIKNNQISSWNEVVSMDNPKKMGLIH